MADRAAWPSAVEKISIFRCERRCRADRVAQVSRVSRLRSEILRRQAGRLSYIVFAEITRNKFPRTAKVMLSSGGGGFYSDGLTGPIAETETV
jgi:hypothetical protein